MYKNVICGEDCTNLTFLDKGGFGDVYEAQDRLGNNIVVKIIERKKIARNEFKILNILDGIKGVPKIYKFYEIKNACAISMEHLGISILNPKAGLNFSDIGTLANFTVNAIKILKNIHSKGIVHNDLKPQQFLINTNRKFSLVDYGFSKKYISQQKHKEQKIETKVIGSFLMASYNCHDELTLSRRDDFISLGYMLVYLYKRKLP